MIKNANGTVRGRRLGSGKSKRAVLATDSECDSDATTIVSR